jgi:hypothetical protein
MAKLSGCYGIGSLLNLGGSTLAVDYVRILNMFDDQDSLDVDAEELHEDSERAIEISTMHMSPQRTAT